MSRVQNILRDLDLRVHAEQYGEEQVLAVDSEELSSAWIGGVLIQEAYLNGFDPGEIINALENSIIMVKDGKTLMVFKSIKFTRTLH